MKRHGIGNVIAAAIMVFLLIFTVSQLYVYNLDKLDDYNRVAAQMLNTSGQRGNERISITNAQLDVSSATTKVTLTITNTGGTTTHIVDVWMDDVTDSTRPHQHCFKASSSCNWSTELYVGSGLSLAMPQLDSNMPTNHVITVKVFTELGVSTSVQLLPPGLAGTQSNLLATTQMTLVPPNPITSNDIITLLTITNTNSLGVAFTSLTPDICLVQGNTVPLISTVASGTATGGDSFTLIDTNTHTPSWTTDQWKNYLLVITSGTGVGQSRLIASNNPPTVLTVTQAWTTNPDITSKYAIRTDCHAKTALTGIATSGASFTLTDTNTHTPSWTMDQWKYYLVTITAGTGAGQTRVITSNSGTVLTVSTAWSSPNPGAGSQYTIQSTIDVTGTAELGTTTTLTDTDKAWTTMDQWKNYLVTITAGTGSGQTALIASNNANTLTISGTWTSPGADSKYMIQTNTCDATTGATTLSPVTCTLVQGPSPSSVSFLQAGGSITFQWIYAVAAIVPDSSLTFTASYVNIATTDGLLASQIPSQVAIVRAAGGATANSGGNFASAFGDLVNLFPTFQFSTDCGVNWATATGISRSASPLLFRVSLVNVGSTTIQFGTGSEAFLQKIGASSSKDFYVIQSFGSPPSCPLTSYSSLQSIAPGATLTLYFAATGAGGNNAQSLSGNPGERYIVTVVLSGTRTSGPGVPPGGSPFAQAITVLLVTAA